MTKTQQIRKLYQLSEAENFGFSVDEMTALEERLGVSLPMELKNYYLSLGKEERINYSHNQLLRPTKEVGFSADKYLIFFEENQGVVAWGIKAADLSQDNPAVWGNYGTEEEPDWYIEASNTQNFFLLMAVYNGTLGGLKYNANYFGQVEPSTLKSLEESWTLVAEISDEKQRVFTKDFEEVISVSFDHNGCGSAIFIGTSNQERFDQLLEVITVDWSYTSYEDDEECEED